MEMFHFMKRFALNCTQYRTFLFNNEGLLSEIEKHTVNTIWGETQNREDVILTM